MTTNILDNDHSFAQVICRDQYAHYGTLLLLVCATSVVMLGCESKIKTYPVQGAVRFSDGTPVSGGVVIFVSRKTGTQSRARIQEDGTYELGTLTKDDGSVAGVHRVAVKPLVLGPGMAAEHPIARKFQSASTSGLEFDVRTDGPNKFDIEIEPPDKRRLQLESRDLPDF